MEVGAVDVFPKAVVLYLVQPASEVSDKSRLSCRVIKYKQHCPQKAKEEPGMCGIPGFARGIVINDFLLHAYSKAKQI